MIRKIFAPVSVLLVVFALAIGVWAQQPAPVDASQDPVYQTLSTSDVYVDPLIHEVDTQKLEQAAMQAQGNPHTRVKIAILYNLPDQYQSRSQYAAGLQQNLGLDKNGLILVVWRGRQAGVQVVTGGLDADEKTRLARQYAPAVKANLTDGTAALAQALAGDINGREYRGAAGLWVVFLLVIVVVAALLISASRRKKRAMMEARVPVQALRENVLSGIEYVDGYVDTLPKNNPDSDQVRIFRQAASAKYEQAAKILDRATEMTDLNRANGLLGQAQADVAQSRRYLDHATGGTGKIPGDDAVRPQPLPDSQPEVQQIPANQRGVSFFSSRPAPLSSLVPVTVTIGGQSRQVLVTPDEANELRQGRMPQVLAFQQGGRYVPWYEYSGYDPYNDYWLYENRGWGGFGPGLVAGFVGAELMGDFLSPGYGMGGYGMGGYAPYAYATDMPMYQGYADPGYGGGYGDSNFAPAGGYDTGGADFGGGQDTNGYDNGGGSYDTGGADFGGGSDFGGGGFDTGGADFGGGGDFGGGDSGGGGGDSF